LKLDEIIHALGKAHNEMISIEKLSDADLDVLTTNFDKIRAECELRKRQTKLKA
jgi:low affinity Fe/Cu permease